MSSPAPSAPRRAIPVDGVGSANAQVECLLREAMKARGIGLSDPMPVKRGRLAKDLRMNDHRESLVEFRVGLALSALGAIGCASLLLAPLELVQPPTAIAALVKAKR